MGKDTTSKTEKEIWVEESLFGGSGHYKTTITNPDGTKDEGRGNTPEESQKVASDKHDKRR